MHRTVPAAVAGLLLAALCSSSPAAPPLVSRLHVVSVHVRDRATFDAVFLFFRDVLRLPLLYGEPSKPGDARRLYSGFSVGNAYIEPCGPYQDDAPYAEAQPARFHGFTFASGLPLAEAAAELDARRIPHGGLVGPDNPTAFIYVRGPLAGNRQAVSLWEVRDANDRVQPASLASALADAQGGALGVVRLAEVRVAHPSNQILAAWRTLLDPGDTRGGGWAGGAGPAIRFVPGDSTGIESIVLEVRSLDIAKRALEERGLLARASAASAWLAASKVWGLNIELNQAR